MLVDDYSRACWVLPLRAKSDALVAVEMEQGGGFNRHVPQREVTGNRKDKKIL
jgi:hypothetical protein